MKPTQQGIQSVEVAGRLLRALIDEDQAMMLRDLAKAAGMPPAKAHRYLVSLGRLGLVEQDVGTGRYDLANFALQLGLARLGRIDAVSAATIELENLRNRTGESVFLAVWGGQGAVVVRVLESHHLSFVVIRVGALMPLTWSATGLIFAAFLPEKMTHKFIAKELEANRKQAGTKVPKTKKEFDAVVTAIRQHGISRFQGAVSPGINALSAPIFNHLGDLVAVITVLGAERNLDISWDGGGAQSVHEAARAVSIKLGYSPSEKGRP